MADNLYLIGFMGTGKTSVGRELSRQLKREFLEIDELIEAGEGKPITAIFKNYGEQFFRARERAVLQEISLKSDLVVSCGGGIVIRRKNRELMKTSGKVICLYADPEAVYKRVKDCADRPLLNVPDPEIRIKELLEQRAAFYQDADFTVDTTFLTVAEVVAVIREKLKDDQKISDTDQ